MINFPDAPTVGQIFTNASLQWLWDGAKWLVPPSSGGGGGGGGGDITGVAAGSGLTGGGTSGDVILALNMPVAISSGGTGATTAPIALTNLGAVPLAGGTMTGLLTLSGAPTVNLQAATKLYVDSAVAAISGGGPFVPMTGNSNITGNINMSGNVGVGTTGPGYKFEVAGNTSNFYPTANAVTVATAQQITIGEASNNSAYRLALGYAVLGSAWTGVIQTTAAGAGGPLAINANGGNVGIGTTAPNHLLDINGAMRIRDGANRNLRITGPFSLGDGTSLRSMNDAFSGYQSLEVVASNIFLNPVGTGVGIGTASPVSKLHIITPSATNNSIDGSTGRMVNWWEGASGAPITTNAPTALITRYEAITTDAEGGQNAALAVYSTGNNVSGGATIAQVNAFTAKARQIGSGDCVGGYFVAEQNGTPGTTGLNHAAFGIFSLAVAGAPNMTALGINPAVCNSTGSDYTYGGLIAGGPSAIGSFVQAITGKRCSAGAFFWGQDAGANFDVGIGFNFGSTHTADIQTNSSAVASYLDHGAHTFSIDLNTATISGADIRLHLGDTITNANPGLISFSSNVVVPFAMAYGSLDGGGSPRVLLGIDNNAMATNVTRLRSAGGGVSIEDLAANTLVAIQNGGNVGIGTTSPVAPLTIRTPSTADIQLAAANPLSVLISNGSTGAPVTAEAPTLLVSRTENIANRDSVWSSGIYSVVVGYGLGQANGINAYTRSAGDGESMGIGSRAEQYSETGNWRAAYAFFGYAGALKPNTSAIAIQLDNDNQSGHAGTWPITIGAGNPAFIGIDIQMSGNAHQAGVVIRQGPVAVGFGIHSTTTINTASFRDDSNSPAVLQAIGTHSYGIDFTGAAFNVASIAIPANSSISIGTAQHFQSGGVQYCRVDGGNYWQNNAGSATYAIFGAGGCANQIGAWAIISAREMKQEIAPYKRGLDAIEQLNPVVFRYRSGTPFARGEEPSEPQIGLLLDEVEPYMPELVGETNMTINEKEVPVGTMTPGLLVYALVNSCKELVAMNAALETRIAALEAR